MKNNRFMEIALEEARMAAARDEVPVGACLVLGDEIIARAGNAMRQQGDPTAHAEMLVIRQGLAQAQKKRLDGFDLYVTLEPCTMCAGAIALSHIRRLYYGASDAKAGHGNFFSSAHAHHKPEIYNGIGTEAAQALLRDFFQHLREK